MRLIQLRLWCLVGCVLVFAGCGSKSSDTAPVVNDAGGGATATESATSSSASDSTAAAVARPMSDAKTPDGAVRNALEAVQNGQLQAAYDFLPVGYQADVDGLIQDFAQRMDPEIWEELFVTLETGVKVLREQKELILPMMASPGQEEQQAQLEKNWDKLVDTLEYVVESDLSRLDKMKSLSSREFLKSTGNKLLAGLRELASSAGQNPIEQLGKADVHVVAMSGETCVVNLKFPNDQAPREVEFVLTGGRWIPESLASSWPESMNVARQQLESLNPETIAAQKEQVMRTLGLVNGVFQQMLTAKEPDEFKAAAFPLFLQAMQMQSLFTPQPKGPENGVMLIIEGELSDEAYTKLLSDLEQLTDNPERATRTSSNSNGQVTIEIRPVEDPVAFADKLTFGEDKQVDVSARTIRMKLKAE